MSEEFDYSQVIDIRIGGASVNLLAHLDEQGDRYFDLGELVVAFHRTVAAHDPALALELHDLLEALYEACVGSEADEPPSFDADDVRSGATLTYDDPDAPLPIKVVDSPNADPLSQILGALGGIQDRLALLEQTQQADAAIADGGVELPPYTPPQPRPEVKGVTRRAQGEPGVIVTNRLHPVGE